MIATLALTSLIAAAPAPEMIAIVTQVIPRGAAVDTSRLDVVPRSEKELPRRARPHIWRDGERLRARRTLRAGTVLGQFDVEPMPDVNAGDPVLVELKAGNVRVTASAIAKEDGFMGETIWVQNDKTNLRLRVRVVESGRVAIIMPGKGGRR